MKELSCKELVEINGGEEISAWWKVPAFILSPLAGFIVSGLIDGYNDTINY